MPKASLQFALEQLTARGLVLRAVSRFWQTPAFPAGSGPDYINAAAAVATDLPAAQLLALLHEVEAGLGRSRDHGRWQARGIDLDLLALGAQVLPDAAEQDRWRHLPPARQAEIAPGWRHPRIGLTVAQMRDALPAAAFEGMRLAIA